MLRKFILIFTAVFMLTTVAAAEEQKQASGPPPMLVTTEKIIDGKAEPVANFIGTVYFSRTAEVAAEISGIVEKVFIEDGEVVKAGDQLMRLDDGLLATEISATRALYEQSIVDVEQADKDYRRIANLHEQDAIATSEYETYATRLNRLKKQVLVLKARLDKQLLEQEKKVVRAPFNGLVIENLVEVGEWVNIGGVIATVADNHSLEAHIDIPANVIPYLSRGKEVDLSIGGQDLKGRFIAVIPRGDVSTRTFVAKFQLTNNGQMIEGMQANVSLPISKATESLLVPRDAIINSYGKDVVFINDKGQARMINVDVVGYSGEMAGVRSTDLNTGQEVVVKGSERIRDGQPLRTE